MSNSSRRFAALRREGAALIAATVILLAFTSASKGEDGTDLLAHAGLTAVEKDYRGRQMIIDFSRMTPLVTKLTVMSQPGGRERREYAASKSIAVIDGDYFYQYYPERKLVVKRKLPGEGGFDSLQKESLKQTLVSYELTSSSSEPIAGRKARLYEFSPRQAGTRPVRKVWVDVETGLVLRMEVYGTNNRLFWLSVFENVDYESMVSPASFSLEIPAGVKVVESQEGRCFTLEEAEQITGISLSLPRYLPDGFVQKCVRARRSADYGEIQVVYSDGLSLLSLFESSRYRPFKPAGPGRTAAVEVGGEPGVWHRLGLVSALHWKSPGVYMTILGEVSRDELVKVAESTLPLRELSRP